MTIRVGWVMSVIAAVLAGGLGWFVGSGDVPDAPPVGDRVQAAVDGLRDQHVYVAPDSTELLSDADHARLESLAAAARPETFVVVWNDSSEAGYYLASEALRQIGAELDRPGYYVSVGRGGVSSDDVGIEGDYVNADNFEEGQAITAESVATRISEIIADSDGREFSEATTTGSDYWGGTGGTIAAGLLLGSIGGIGLACVVAALWFIVRRSVRSRP